MAVHATVLTLSAVNTVYFNKTVHTHVVFMPHRGHHRGTEGKNYSKFGYWKALIALLILKEFLSSNILN